MGSPSRNHWTPTSRSVGQLVVVVVRVCPTFGVPAISAVPVGAVTSQVILMSRSTRAGSTCIAGVTTWVQPLAWARTLYQPSTTSHRKKPVESVSDGLARLSSDMMSEPFGTSVNGPAAESARCSVTVAPWIGRPNWSVTTPEGSM